MSPILIIILNPAELARIEIIGNSYYVGTYGRVARWYIFKPKILIWVNFRGSCN
jgi:hypothetical protein